MAREYPWRDETRLRTAYEELGSIESVADEWDASTATIYTWMERFGIKRRNWGSPPDDTRYKDEGWLREQYRAKKRSTNMIADECGCSRETIRRWLDRHGIGSRSGSEAQRVRMENDPEWRERLTGLGADAIRDMSAWEQWDGQEREAFRERLSEQRTGEGNPMYGVTGEDHHSWREDTEYATIYHTPKWKRIRHEVYERDGYCCQVCEDPGAGPLHAHHETPISEGGQPFALDNLVTVCEACHYAIHGG
jgi:transposase